MARECVLIWGYLDGGRQGSRTHVKIKDDKTLCGVNYEGRVIDDQYGEPECAKCHHLLNVLPIAELIEDGIEEFKESS